MTRGRPFTTESARAARALQTDADPREQFARDLRGDHDGVASYAWLPPADSTPTIAEVESWTA